LGESINILKTGIEIEKNGISSYLDFAFHTKDETGKNMFITLAQDEFDHMITLENQLENFASQKTWVKREIPKSIIERLSPQLREIEKINSGSGVGELSALKTALDFEKSSIEFYKEGRRKIFDKQAIEIFDRLLEMEESHYKLIQAEIDHIKGTGFWFGIKEFSLEGAE